MVQPLEIKSRHFRNRHRRNDRENVRLEGNRINWTGVALHRHVSRLLKFGRQLANHEQGLPSPQLIFRGRPFKMAKRLFVILSAGHGDIPREEQLGPGFCRVQFSHSFAILRLD